MSPGPAIEAFNDPRKPQAVVRSQHAVVRFSDSFKGIPLRKVEFLCGQGCSIVGVVVADKSGNLATVNSYGHVEWHMADEPVKTMKSNPTGLRCAGLDAHKQDPVVGQPESKEK